MLMTHLLEAYPAQIHQGEKQLVRYKGNHYVLTPYATTSQTTTVTLSSPNIENYSRLKPTSHTDTSITYGPYEGVSGFSVVSCFSVFMLNMLAVFFFFFFFFFFIMLRKLGRNMYCNSTWEV